MGTQTGNTETVAGYIAEEAGVEVADVGDYSAGDLAEFDGLIVGCPTWNTDADEYRSGTAWDDLIDDIKGTDLSCKRPSRRPVRRWWATWTRLRTTMRRRRARGTASSWVARSTRTTRVTCRRTAPKHGSRS